jgi:hypothetical protein
MEHEFGEGRPLFEELLLLALRDDRGTVRGGTWPDIAIAGGILSELALRNVITLDETKRSNRVRLHQGSLELKHPLLSAAVEMIRAAKRPRSAQRWVSRFSSMKQLRARAAGELVRTGVLGEEEHRVLRLFRRVRYPLRQPGVQEEIYDRVRQAVHSDAQVNVRTASLVGIAHATKLLASVFDRKELRRRRRRIREIMDSSPEAVAANEAVKAVQAAIIASTAAAGAAVSAGSAGSN